MPDAFNIKLSSNATEVVSKLERFPAEMAKAIAGAMRKENELTIAAAIQKRMSGPRPAVLGRRTSELARSVHQNDPVIDGNTILSSIGSNKLYAGFHEFGFHGNQQVRAHTRNRHTYAGGSKTYAVLDASGRISRRSRKPKSSTSISVRAHTRAINYAGRPYLQPTIVERASNYSATISTAIVLAWGGAS